MVGAVFAMAAPTVMLLGHAAENHQFEECKYLFKQDHVSEAMLLRGWAQRAQLRTSMLVMLSNAMLNRSAVFNVLSLACWRVYKK